ncbi:MAG: ATP-binding protein, partial [Oscillospiraceae bacterium]|nr:ATP-binding protein [Oscillospiraceae bacterium]
LALWLAGRVSRQLVAPINAIDPEDPGGETVYEELAPLLRKLRSQNRRIQKQVEDLRRRREEFAAITENMSEGLLVIDKETRVLSHNTAALRLLEASGPVEEGGSVLALDREAGFRRCVEESLAGRRCEALLERDGACRRCMASPVEQEGAVTGAVLIVLDVTEKEQRETLRREFTANVSHELKTPLTSILGTAEILENGLVRPEDIPHFAGNIRRETQRLIGLVNDIIKLSRLDEGGHAGEWETVDLYRLSQSVLKQLAGAAEKKQVSMALEGGAAPVRGVPQILEEIVYNLCDNAVAYNRPGGSVTVTVSDTAEGARLTVRDTGVGIPREAQGRVFERFYRVDKSRSGGGTGLGLSIVKHGAAYLGAAVALESEPGMGSTFTLSFPKAAQSA